MGDDRLDEGEGKDVLTVGDGNNTLEFENVSIEELWLFRSGNHLFDQFVSAMASYSVPSGVGNVIPQETKDALQSILVDEEANCLIVFIE